MTTSIRSIGDEVTVVRAVANTSLTAGGGGDNSAVTGVIIDRAVIGWPQSAVVALPFTATLAATATLSLTPTVQSGNASNLSDAASLAAPGATVVATGPAGGGTVTGCHEINVSLAGAGRYVRVNVTPDLSAANTDTAAISGVVVFGGANRLPQ